MSRRQIRQWLECLCTVGRQETNKKQFFIVPLFMMHSEGACKSSITYWMWIPYCLPKTGTCYITSCYVLLSGAWRSDQFKDLRINCYGSCLELQQSNHGSKLAYIFAFYVIFN